MNSSIKINKRMDVCSQKIAFTTEKNIKKKPKKKVKGSQIDLNKIVKRVWGAIPVQAKVIDIDRQKIESEAIRTVYGTRRIVASPAMQNATDSNAVHMAETKDWNAVLYHDVSGVRTNAAEYANKAIHGMASSIIQLKDGWVKHGGGWKYRQNGQYVRGWRYIGGNWYYFHVDEYMCTGWRMIGEQTYYFKTEADAIKSGSRDAYGYMWTGWRKIENKWYYFKTKEDASKEENKNAYGYMWTGWRKINGEWYYMQYDGQLVEKSELYNYSGDYVYYIDHDGVLVGKTDETIDSVEKVLQDIEKEAEKLPELYGNTNFIDDQREFDENLSTFGLKGNLNRHACGAIAMYNVMHAFGDDITFKKIATDIVKESGELSYIYSDLNDQYPTNADGVLGTDPFYISAYLQRCGYKTKMKSIFEVKGEEYDLKAHDAYIALYAYPFGAHYEALIPNVNGGLTAYNGNADYLSFSGYLETKEKSEAAKMMWIYEIDR